MDSGGHLFKKIQNIQNKAAHRRDKRMNEVRAAIYAEKTFEASLKNELTPEQIATARQAIKEKAARDKRHGKLLTWVKIIITLIITTGFFYYLIAGFRY